MAEVAFREWTAARTLRAPVYKGLRDDKDPAEVVLEREEPPPRRLGENGPVRVSVKTDYAVRAMIELARATEEQPGRGRADRRRSGHPAALPRPRPHGAAVRGTRPESPGAEGGYWLARPADELTLTEIISELDGPLASVRGEPPEELTLRGDAKPLSEVWIALRANMREVLDSVTIADLASGQLPEPVLRIAGSSEG